MPGGIRIVCLHVLGEKAGLFSEILLIYDSIAPDDKGHYAGRPVLRRESHESKSFSHLAIYDVAFSSARAMFPLQRQDTEVITAVWSESAFPAGITLSDRRCHQRSDGTLGFARSCFQ